MNRHDQIGAVGLVGANSEPKLTLELVALFDQSLQHGLT
jgi:hypothetical protein